MSGGNRINTILDYGQKAIEQPSDSVLKDRATNYGDGILVAQKPNQSKKQKTDKKVEIDKLILSIINIFTQNFRVKEEDLKKVKVRIIDSDEEWKNKARDEYNLDYLERVKNKKKFAPDIILKYIDEKYIKKKKEVPKQYLNSKGDIEINENTILTEKDEEKLVPRLAELFAQLSKAPFYSPISKTIYVRKEDFDEGVIIHEMTHAAASKQWRQLLSIMRARGMKNVTEFDEAMTSWISNDISKKWVLRQPKDTTIKDSMGIYNLTYAKIFFKQVSKQKAYEAYFNNNGIDYKNKEVYHLEDVILIGSGRGGKLWKWPWRNN